MYITKETKWHLLYCCHNNTLGSSLGLDPWNCPKELHIVINGTVIELKSETTLLEVTLDDQLSFSSHVSNVCRKASCQTGVLLTLHNLIPMSAKLITQRQICYTTSSHILSDCLAFLSFFWCQKSRLEQIQERAFRAIYCDDSSTCEEPLQTAKLPILHTWRLQPIAVIMYKEQNGLAPTYIADLFVVTSSQYHLRNSDFTETIPRSRTVAYGKHSLTYFGPVIESKLDRSVWWSESLDIFNERNKLVNLTRLLDSTCEDCFFM